MKRTMVAATAYLLPAVWFVVAQQCYESSLRSDPLRCQDYEPYPTFWMLAACAVAGCLSLAATLLRGHTVAWWRRSTSSMMRIDLVIYALPFFGALCLVAFHCL